jgi:hypothetical protein
MARLLSASILCSINPIVLALSSHISLQASYLSQRSPPCYLVYSHESIHILDVYFNWL